MYIVFSRRQKGDRISIWIRDMPHSEIKDLASDMIIITKLLDCGSPYVLEYQRHKESVKTGTSFRSSASENKKNSVLSQDNVEENARARLKSSESNHS